MARVRTIEEFEVGQSFEARRVVTADDVRAFAELSGDRNRIHLDAEYAQSTRFGRCIVHGAFLGALVSKVLGMDLPGPGAVYLSQTLEFSAPAYVGEEVVVRVRVDEVDGEARVLVISNEITDGGGRELARGRSKVKLPKRKS